MAMQVICGKFSLRELIQVPLNESVVSFNRTRLAMIKEMNHQLRLPKWEDAV